MNWKSFTFFSYFKNWYWWHTLFFYLQLASLLIWLCVSLFRWSTCQGALPSEFKYVLRLMHTKKIFLVSETVYLLNSIGWILQIQPVSNSCPVIWLCYSPGSFVLYQFSLSINPVSMYIAFLVCTRPLHRPRQAKTCFSTLLTLARMGVKKIR